jgi:hypothetical protein
MHKAIRAAIVAMFVAVAITWSGFASAQQKPAVQVLIEDLNQYAAGCGINKYSLESIAALTLRNNGMQVVENSTVYLFIRAGVVPALTGGNINVGCFVSHSVRMIIMSPLTQPVGGIKPRNALSIVSLCEESGNLIGTQSNLLTLVIAALENDIKLCLGQLDY